MNQGIIGRAVGPHTAEAWRAHAGVSHSPVIAGSLIGASTTWPGSANTLSGWVEIVASSPFDACMIDLMIWTGGNNTVDGSVLIDISTGAAAAEAASILIDGIPVYGRGNYTHLRIPVRILAGTRLSYRMQAATASLANVPRVGVGFIRDIPGFPSGTSVQRIGTINRAASSYTNISVAAAVGLRRNVWATVGDLPATGKVIYLIPYAGISSGTSAVTHTIVDWGWHEASGLAVNTGVAEPREIWAAETLWYVTANESLDPTLPTVPIPGGYQGGCIVAAVDSASNLNNKFMCLAVME